MTNTLQPYPIFRAWALDGTPLAFGKIYTYESGTSTPLDTYVSYSGSANTNPVILDANGEANIWYGPYFYTVTIKDSNDVQLSSTDNVGPGPSGSSSAAGFGTATDLAVIGTVADIGTIGSHFANITGAGWTITSFGTTATLDAPLYLVKVAGAGTITQSANIFTPMGADIITSNNDHFWLEYLGSGAVRLFNYARADGSFECTTLTVTVTANLP